MAKIAKDSLIALGILLAAVATATFTIYLPQRSNLKELEAGITTQKAALANDARQSTTLPELVQKVQSLKKRYSGFDRRLPKRKELGGFLREITGCLSLEKLSNELIEPGNPAQEELFHTLPIIMKFEGSYLSLAGFLERIDKMQRLTRVQSLNIESDSKEKTLEIELRLNIYFTES